MIVRAEPVPDGMRFLFHSTWRIPAELIAIWNAIGGVDRWPDWWVSIEAVRVLRGPALPVSVGTAAEYRIRSPLLYHLTFQSEVTAFDLGKWIETRIQGNLAGTGRWDFAHADGITSASLAWHVTVTRPVLATLARAAPVRAAMSWAHDRVMESGARGLTALVAARTPRP